MKIDELKTQIHEAKHFAGGCVNALEGLETMLAIVEEVGDQELRDAIIQRSEGDFLKAVDMLGERYFAFTNRLKAIVTAAADDEPFLRSDCGK